MYILSKRNGIALMGVLTVLLVLTLLLPVMFTMSTNAVKDSVQSKDAQTSSYLARTMIEMSVAAFEEFYDTAQEELNDPALSQNNAQKLEEFMGTNGQQIKASTMYMYNNMKRDGDVFVVDSVEYSLNDSLITDSNDTTTYIDKVGKADCTLTFDKSIKYYKVSRSTGETTEYETTEEKFQTDMANSSVEDDIQLVRIEHKNVVFQSEAVVNGVKRTRRCIMVLPTKPAEQNWVAPATLEANQIFPNVEYCTSKTKINADSSLDKDAVDQPLYIFSCIGNMVLSTDNLSFKVDTEIRVGYLGLDKDETIGKVGSYISYEKINQLYNNGKFRIDLKPVDLSLYSFGLHPTVGTRDPDDDPQFNCLRTYNMNDWHDDAQMDNFVAYTATNAIEVDMDVNLAINPCRANRIGDGLAKNSSLYKILVFQAPTIVFNGAVNTFVSLYEQDDAYRMTSLILAAPENTPYSYLNANRNQTVKAGKVFFAEDVYVWLIPYDENGSNYKTQTVYYKNKDIILYKVANKGDIYYFNSEVPATTSEGEQTTQGFSLTGYFMDVYYLDNASDDGDSLNLWKKIEKALFHEKLKNSEKTYVKDDFKWIGNIYSGEGDKLPVVDDFYVVWES